MANICFTQYVVEGDMSELKDLYAKMRSLEEGKAPLVDEGADKTWLANLVNLLGGDWNNFECRGDFYNVQLDEEKGVLRYTIESKWLELVDLREFIGGRYPSFNIYFRAEESGCGIFETNDQEGKYSELYKIGYWNDEGDLVQDHFFTDEELYAAIGKICGTSISSDDELEQAIAAYNDENEYAELSYVHFEEPSDSIFF